MHFAPSPFRCRVIALIAALLLPCSIAAPANAAGLSFGIQANNTALSSDPAMQQHALDQMRTLGVRALRITLSWSRVASGPGCASASAKELRDDTNPCYVWDYIDRVVGAARDHDIQVLASMYEVPRWANGRNDIYWMGGNDGQFKRVAERYQAFAHATATRYRPGSPHGTIAYYTILNEPNSDTFWHPHDGKVAKRFADAYSRAAREIKGVARQLKVAPGPTGPKSTTKPIDFIRAVQPFLAKNLKSGGGPKAFIDAWAHNPYPRNQMAPRDRTAFHAPSVGINNLGDLFHALDASPATRGLPVWATEFSYQTNPPDRRFGVSLVNQATYLAELYDILASSGRVTLGFWYVLTDPPTEPDWQSGMIRANGSRKPSFAMYQRPISRSAASVRRGGAVRLWGASNIDLKRGKLVWSKTGRGGWTPVPGQRHRSDGSITAAVRLRATRFFAVRDGKGVGPSRKVAVG